MRNFPKAKAKGRDDAPKKNWLYALQARGYCECAPNVDLGMLKAS